MMLILSIRKQDPKLNNEDIRDSLFQSTLGIPENA